MYTRNDRRNARAAQRQPGRVNFNVGIVVARLQDEGRAEVRVAEKKRRGSD